MQGDKITPNDILKLGIFGLFVLLLFFVSKPSTAVSFGECDQYGLFSMYDILTDSCKCMSGYVFGKDVFGNTTCVSADNVCHDKYGYNSRYNSSNNSCECSYGYEFGKDLIGRTQCISQDDLCRDQLGYNSRYNSLSNKCQCSYGYVIDGGKCEDGNTVCRNKHGLYSSYDSLSNKCECDSGYTLDDNNQCVEKQNNVYFYLKELDTDNRKAIIKSEYDFGYYLISYGLGCYSSSFKRYLNRDIVVNLGTDYYVDSWDKIVLQDDSEVCDITRVERANSSTTLFPEEETPIIYIPSPNIEITPIPSIELPKPTPKSIKPKIIDPIQNKKIQNIIQKAASSTILEATSKTEKDNGTTTPKESKVRWYKKFSNSISNFFHSVTNWFSSFFR